MPYKVCTTCGTRADPRSIYCKKCGSHFGTKSVGRKRPPLSKINRENIHCLHPGDVAKVKDGPYWKDELMPYKVCTTCGTKAGPRSIYCKKCGGHFGTKSVGRKRPPLSKINRENIHCLHPGDVVKVKGGPYWKDENGNKKYLYDKGTYIVHRIIESEDRIGIEAWHKEKGGLYFLYMGKPYKHPSCRTLIMAPHVVRIKSSIIYQRSQ